MTHQVMDFDESVRDDVKELVLSNPPDLKAELVELANDYKVGVAMLLNIAKEIQVDLEARDTSVLSRIIISDEELRDREFPERISLCGSWFRKGDTGMVYGWRGIGKSWFTLSLARSLAAGRQFGPWDAGPNQNVLIVDGEMNIQDVQARDRKLCWMGGRIDYLSWELWQAEQNKPMKLTDPELRNRLVYWMQERKIDVVLIDNLSTLVDGENDAESWLQSAEMIRMFRRHDITTILVHHAGKDGNQRGTSKREDELHWSINLINDRQENEDAAFLAQFEKCRNGRKPDTARFCYSIGDDKAEISWRWWSPSERILELVSWKMDGLNDLASAMNMRKEEVASYVAGLVDSGRLEWKGKTLVFPGDE